MAFWLVKSEPSTWSWAQQLAKGAEGEPWTGVRNYQARNYLRQMHLGDVAFFYHSVLEKRIVGIVDVMREAYTDPTDSSERFSAVDVKALCSLPSPLSLEKISQTPALHDVLLLKQSRLSVMPISAEAWSVMCTLGGVSWPIEAGLS